MPGKRHPEPGQKDEALAFRKAADYCASQEHCISELRSKLTYWGFAEVAEKTISRLLDEGFIDEKRYAQAFARGKFRNLHWGKIKISAELRNKRIASDTISIALQEIDEDEYLDCLETLLKKKLKELGSRSRENEFKAMRFALSKGFESEQVQKLIRKGSKTESEE